MILSLMFILLAIATVIQPNIKRFLIALVFTSEVIIHDLFFSGLSGDLYFFVAALGNMIAMIILYSVSIKYRLAEKLSLICLISIPSNFLGYILWYNSYPTWIYEILFILIYSCAVIVMLKGSRHARSIKSGSNNTGIHGNIYHSSKLSSKNM